MKELLAWVAVIAVLLLAGERIYAALHARQCVALSTQNAHALQLALERYIVDNSPAEQLVDDWTPEDYTVVEDTDYLAQLPPNPIRNARCENSSPDSLTFPATSVM